MVNTMPTLLALDLFMVTDEERLGGLKVKASSPFKSLSTEHMLLVGLPQYTPNTTAEEHLVKFEIDLY